MQSKHVDRKASQNAPRNTSRLARAIGFGIVTAVSLAGAGFGAVGCLTRPLCEPDCRPHGTNLFVSTVEQTKVDKIDLLFMIDNSSSMADKQKVLQQAVPDLVNRLVSPNCVNKTTDPPSDITPMTDPSAPCPDPNQTREFTPIRNIHIGIVSSSLGGHGATNPSLGACIVAGPGEDNAELVGSLPRYTANPAPTPPLDPQGFLDWNPDTHPSVTTGEFNTDFVSMVGATGQDGCGFEAQLESIYRFLADPAPPQDIKTQPCQAGSTQLCAFKDGLDQKILDQRAAFLRPDSLLAVIMLTDENDCSVMDDGPYFNVLQFPSASMPGGSRQCAANPNDPCCFSCGTAPPAGCPADSCTNITVANPDKLNLRCFNDKQRFGIDFLYPTQRYVNALSLASICTSNHTLDPNDPGGCPDLDQDGKPDVFQNPVYSDLQNSGKPIRSPSLVFLAGITGVPWQDIATADSGTTSGTDLKYMTAEDLATNKVWDQILGDVNTYTKATDPHMIEDINPRGGITGTNGTQMQDPKNGHEYTISAQNDLEYACIFALPTGQTYDCSAAGMNASNCDCLAQDQTDHKPLCQLADNSYSFIQGFAKAYPGLRELQTLKDFALVSQGNSIVASICARNLTNTGASDFGYRPAVTAIVDRLAKALQPTCLPRQLNPLPDGTIPCSIIEANPQPETCDPAIGRSPVTNAEVIQTVQARLKSQGVCDGPNQKACADFSYCTIDESTDPTCHTALDAQLSPSIVPGWCYVDPATQSGDNKLLVQDCPSTQQRLIRFVGSNTPEQGAYALIACFGS